MSCVVADVGISATGAVVMLFAYVDIFCGCYCGFVCCLGYDSIRTIRICACYHSSVSAKCDVNYPLGVNPAIILIQYAKSWVSVCCGKFKRSAVYREFLHISQSTTDLNGYRNIPAFDNHFIADDAVSIGLDGEPAVAAEGQVIRSYKYTCTRCLYLVLALQHNFKVKCCSNI